MGEALLPSCRMRVVQPPETPSMAIASQTSGRRCTIPAPWKPPRITTAGRLLTRTLSRDPRKGVLGSPERTPSRWSQAWCARTCKMRAEGSPPRGGADEAKAFARSRVRAQPPARPGLRHQFGPRGDAALELRGGADVRRPQVPGRDDGAPRRTAARHAGVGAVGGWDVLLRRRSALAQEPQPRAELERRRSPGGRRRGGDPGGRGRGGVRSGRIEGSYAVRPRVVFAWLESSFKNTATRWVFDY